ncbi:Plug and carboxypeptidase regulatory-like domain-containing protein [Chryseobacterium sp. SSA4.19]|uniref:carboxypeptidase-like regulatory domain-containing protein n=1 Tax=Chryseobacterium sp. SSA4.19 TaxID=2919915 RepID=UPI001F4F694B|nr:carboxypeptidase-like regulatory domain-containing protein [Chryseobacterium sp. SSA4.19]MCJ8152897.1 Plug and carboxypeptidase regulatory-like domain-containing protein [Chryseobacterium sp. SSA4.19]
MKMKISLFLMIFLSVLSFAQKTVSGKITDEDGVAIPSASVTIEEPGKDAILAYAITNSKGEYKVTFTSAEPSVDLKVKAFNQRPLTKQVSNSDQSLSFKMEGEATEIKEVQLKTKMITARGDTIAYDLKAFDSKSDRTLADVMKKIPGIEVNTDGTILYQGNAINKFYVNGKDLMEGGYGTINNSLPKDAVQKVEVLENHQPVKILQNKVPSDQAAINIKLKNSVTMTGRGEVGTGFGEPWLWNVKLTPMFFGQKSQWVVNYKTNNMGEQVENEGNILAFGNRFEGRRINATQNDWLNVENASTPNLPVKRYLMNSVHYVSANYLTNIDKKKEWELKANANYTNNTVERESNSQEDYFNGTSNNINIFNNFYTDKAKGELIFTKNAKKGFFKNTTSFSQYWNADRGIVDRRDTKNNIQSHGEEALESPTTSFQNSLSTIVPWKEKMVNVLSYLSYQTDRQTLSVSPSSYLKIPGFTPNTSSDFVGQSLRLKTFEANHSANIGFSTKGWTFTPEVGFNFKSTELVSDLSNIFSQGTALLRQYSNDLTYTTATPYGSVGVNYKNDSWMLYANFPVNSNNIKADDPLRSVSKEENKVTFEPSIFAQYTFASFWKASVNANINNNFGEINTAYSGFLMTSPSGINAMDPKNPIPQNNNKSAGTRLEYRNPLNNLFFNVNYRFSDAKRNLISNPTIVSGYSVMGYIEQDNNVLTNGYSTEIGKYFPKFKTNASVSYSNNTTKSNAFLDNKFFTNKNNGQSFGVKFNNTYFSWMSIDYNARFSRTKQTSVGDVVTNATTSGFNHNLALFLYPIENHTIGFNWDQIDTNTPDQKYHNGFYDLSYQFTWAKKKIDFELKWINIANKKVFENFEIETIRTTFTRIQLRPSQVMFTVKFNFK